jgi:hypothetical protein
MSPGAALGGSAPRGSALTRGGSGPSAALLGVRRIWARAAHSAFTDLIRFRGQWLCVFREAGSHAGSPGRIRVLSSSDGVRWRSAALLAEPGVDLRDPKLSAAPGGRLMLLCGGTAADPADGRRPRVRFSADGRRWTPPRPILEEGDWLWRATWLRGRAYGITYRVRSRRRWEIALVTSPDGLAYREVCTLAVPGLPNEATLRFLPDDEAVALVRREGGDGEAWIGRSRPPYTRWGWKPSGLPLGGPNFIVHRGGEMWAAGRTYGAEGPRTAILRMTRGRLTPLLELPSAGDCSYPGMVLHGGKLHVSYYSSHEGRACVYFATVRLPGGRREEPG